MRLRAIPLLCIQSRRLNKETQLGERAIPTTVALQTFEIGTSQGRHTYV